MYVRTSRTESIIGRKRFSFGKGWMDDINLNSFLISVGSDRSTKMSKYSDYITNLLLLSLYIIGLLIIILCNVL